MAETTSTETLWKDRRHFMWFPFSFTKYEIKDGRLFTQSGLLKTTFNEVLLYRITDIRMTRSLTQKLCGTGTIELCTKVDHDRHISLVNVKEPLKIKHLLSEVVEKERDKKNIVGKEFYGSATGHAPEHDPHMHAED